jgi:hypothetical protein
MLSIVLGVVLLFAVASAVNAQESANDVMRRFRMPENCQGAIGRFPTNLQSGFQAVYITFTGYMGQTDEYVFNQMVLFILLNYIKTNIRVV